MRMLENVIVEQGSQTAKKMNRWSEITVMKVIRCRIKMISQLHRKRRDPVWFRGSSRFSHDLHEECNWMLQVDATTEFRPGFRRSHDPVSKRLMSLELLADCSSLVLFSRDVNTTSVASNLTPESRVSFNERPGHENWHELDRQSSNDPLCDSASSPLDSSARRSPRCLLWGTISHLPIATEN